MSNRKKKKLRKKTNQRRRELFAKLFSLRFRSHFLTKILHSRGIVLDVVAVHPPYILWRLIVENEQEGYI